MKVVSLGIKNELTYFRKELSSSNSSGHSNQWFDRYNSLTIIFYQEHLLISSIETSLIMLLFDRYVGTFNKSRVLRNLLLSINYFYLYYVIFLSSTSYSYSLLLFVVALFAIAIAIIRFIIYF